MDPIFRGIHGRTWALNIFGFGNGGEGYYAYLSRRDPLVADGASGLTLQTME
jgi:hypothetical protein